jgi:predicted dithiol-disulfide oxidoreductase (DUF899 family)
MATTMDRTEQLQRLLKEEIELKDHCERVAAMRRQLPPGKVLEDYVFTEGPADLNRNDPKDFKKVKLSELFDKDKNELLVYHLMYGPDWDGACPMCTMWVSGFNGISPYVNERVNFVVVAKAPIAKLREYAKKRGWNNIRLLSSYDSTFNRDLEAEEPDGMQNPGISVLVRGDDGKIRHFYSKWAPLDENNNRGIDLLSPVWNLYDLVPSGRDDWYPSIGWWGFMGEEKAK